MSFFTLEFAVFLPAFLILYYICPAKYRYAVVFVGSLVFYAFEDLRLLAVLLGITTSTYIGGLLIGKYKKKPLMFLFGAINILTLAVFKYTNFAIENVNRVIAKTSSHAPINTVEILVAIGISFIIFQSYTYLTDVYYGKKEAEKNFILYGAFVSFFPTILSGPIQKSRNLIPQLKAPKKLTADMAKAGTLLFVWGLAEKVLIANRISAIITPIFSAYTEYSAATLLAGCLLFSLYIYADFGSYSDMARGIALLLGIDIGKNFDNPYLSTSTSEFWNRWHMSLNSWFIDNVYIPLGGNRKGTFRKYLNIFIVFFISGLWHGASNHFIVWGVVNGLLVIFGRLIDPARKAAYKKLNIDEGLSSIVLMRRVIVYALISFTWIFFNNPYQDSVNIIKAIAKINFVDFFKQDFVNMCGATNATVIFVLFLLVFLFVQVKRQNESALFANYNKQPVLFQCIPLAILIVICIFVMLQTETYVNANFIYFQF